MQKIKTWLTTNTIRKILILDAVLVLIAAAYIIATPTPENTDGFEATCTDYETAELRWDEAENAKLYRVYRSTDGENFDLIATTADTSYTDKKLRTGTTYYYTVTSRNGFKSSKMITTDLPAARPVLETPKLKIDLADGQMKLSYSKIDGAIGYEISKDGKVIAKTAETVYVDKDTDGEQHDYSVRAYRYKKSPVFSEKSNKVAVEMEVIDGFDIELFEGDMYITWAKNSYFEDYKLTNGDAMLTKTTGNTYKFENYEKNTPYDFKLVGYTKNDTVQSPAVIKKFEIVEEEMDNEDAIDAAIAWGIHVANDNSFTYGAGARAHRYGCYFCQTNIGPRKNIKGKGKVNGHSYEKTYCCNPFAHALFAHGAGDPAMLKACQSGHGIAMTKGSFTRYGHWKYCGKVSRSNLKKGDVLVRSNHVMTYIGDGNIVQASGGGWDAGSIQVTKLAGRSYSFVMRYTGNGRGYQDVVREIVEPEEEQPAVEAKDEAAGDDKSKDKAASDNKQPKEQAKPEEPVKQAA